jgi:hypothetical protein
MGVATLEHETYGEATASIGAEATAIVFTDAVVRIGGQSRNLSTAAPTGVRSGVIPTGARSGVMVVLGSRAMGKRLSPRSEDGNIGEGSTKTGLFSSETCSESAFGCPFVDMLLLVLDGPALGFPFATGSEATTGTTGGNAGTNSF